jgi:hypothetical protein
MVFEWSMYGLPDFRKSLKGFSFSKNVPLQVSEGSGIALFYKALGSFLVRRCRFSSESAYLLARRQGGSYAMSRSLMTRHA